MLVVLNVVYVLIAIAMIALILMQRGAGASAGSGFGAGASATVFGSTGAGNFLSKATKWLAIVFFAISMYMAWYATHSTIRTPALEQDLGVMGELSDAPAVPVQPDVPAAPVQQAPAVVEPAPAEATDSAPADEQAEAPASQDPAPAE